MNRATQPKSLKLLLFVFNEAAHDFCLFIKSQINLRIMNALLTSTFIMTNFLLRSVICFDSAMTGFKAEKKEKKENSIGDRQDKIKGVCFP